MKEGIQKNFVRIISYDDHQDYYNQLKAFHILGLLYWKTLETHLDDSD